LAASADAQNLSLLGDRQIVPAVDHRFALSNPASVSAPSKKVLQRQLADLGVQRLHIDRRRRRLAAPGPNTSAAPFSSGAFHEVIWLG